MHCFFHHFQRASLLGFSVVYIPPAVTLHAYWGFVVAVLLHCFPSHPPSVLSSLSSHSFPRVSQNAFVVVASKPEVKFKSKQIPSDFPSPHFLPLKHSITYIEVILLLCNLLPDILHFNFIRLMVNSVCWRKGREVR